MRVGSHEYKLGLAAAAEVMRAGGDMDHVLRRMRSVGFSPIACIAGLMEIANLSLPEATRVVHFSDVWPENRS